MSIDISGSAINLFQSEERLELLNDIDRFRPLGPENLPQIVVCGDTSSGKSSVLEALSGIPFPVDSTVCTRFATAIALRHASQEGVTGEASITPSSNATESHRARMQMLSHRILSLESIPALMQEARGLMGVADDSGISKDVLNIKLHGRNLPNLTLVDLPGLIHASRNTEDIGKVQQLVEHYFKQEHSIILTIVSAENPIDSQGILALSRKLDTTGSRSIGVITKPDLLSRPDNAPLLPTILELAENRNSAFKFKEPWHIVRCLNDEERQTGKDRDSLERDLLGERPWDQFPRSQRGVNSLRSRLCDYLQKHISQVLPGLAESLEKKVSSIKSSLEKLGPTRATSVDRTRYLIRLSRRYGKFVSDALDGTYTDSFFHGDNSQNRLRARTMLLTDKFEDEMRRKGHTFEIVPGPFLSIQQTTQPQQISEHDALIKAGKLIESHRGPELPSLFNTRLVGELFKEQSVKWPAFVSAYTTQVCQVVRVFLRRLVQSISPPGGRTAELILRHIFDDAVHDFQETLDKKVRELLTSFQGPFFFSTKSRLQASMKMIEEQDRSRGLLNGALQAQEKITATDANPSEHGNRLKLLQCSRAYYNVALETLIDNVVVLGVESCLLSKLGEMFSPDTVARMDDDMIQLLGGESPETIAERDDLQAQQQKLEASLKTCRRHVSRFGLGFEQTKRVVNGTEIELTENVTPPSSSTGGAKVTSDDQTRDSSDPGLPLRSIWKSPSTSKNSSHGSLKSIFASTAPHSPTRREAQPQGSNAPLLSSSVPFLGRQNSPSVAGETSSSSTVAAQCSSMEARGFNALRNSTLRSSTISHVFLPAVGENASPLTAKTGGLGSLPSQPLAKLRQSTGWDDSFAEYKCMEVCFGDPVSSTPEKSFEEARLQYYNWMLDEEAKQFVAAWFQRHRGTPPNTNLMLRHDDYVKTLALALDEIES